MKTTNIVLAAALLSCTPKQPPAPPFPTGAGCEQAEKRLAELDCDDPKQSGKKLHSPNKSGETWTQVCLRAEKEGKVSMGTDCKIRATTCEEAISCK